MHREVGVKKGFIKGAGRNQSQTQAGVRITAGQVEGRSRDRVSEYTNQGQSWEVRITFNIKKTKTNTHRLDATVGRGNRESTQ